MSLEPGKQFGHYRIVQLLGRGGMGEVYEVEHTTLRRSYALKLLPVEFSSRPDALERFRREAQVMANIEHPNILRVDDFGDTEGRYWLRMEKAEGLEIGDLPFVVCRDRSARATSLQDLADVCDGKLPQDLVLAVLKQILAGLSYAHAHGAIHRDLKPSNILLSRSSTSKAGATSLLPNNGKAPPAPQPRSGCDTTLIAKVADFGLVRLIGEEWVRSQAEISVKRSMSMGDRDTMAGRAEAEGTSTRSLLGTYEYMSPEQKRGEEADERSDIYALGLMTFRLLTGREPGTRPPSRIDRALAKPWDDLVADALEADPADRIPNCSAFVELLGAVESHIADFRQQEAKHAEEEARRQEEARRKQIAAEQARQRREEAAARQAEEARKQREAAERERVQKQQAEERAVQSQAAAAKKAPGKRGRRFGAIVLLLCLGVVAYFAWLPLKQKFAPRDKPSPGVASPSTHTVRPTRARPVGSVTSADFPGKARSIPDLGMEFLPVGAGGFEMGSNDGDSDEKPVHRVTFRKPFWMGKTEVTLAQYREFMKSSGDESGIDWADGDCPFQKGGDYRLSGNKFAESDAQPVVEVSWHNAVAFCKWLTERERKAGRLPTGYVYRLPTEAEWEYAARGGSNAGATSPRRNYKYSGSDNLSDIAWYGSNSGGHTQPVGRKQANELGLHDMSGNVWEWCADYWHENYQGAPSDGSAWVSGGESSRRLLRGGSWLFTVSFCRVAYRYRDSPSVADYYFGFRVVLGVEG